MKRRLITTLVVAALAISMVGCNVNVNINNNTTGSDQNEEKGEEATEQIANPMVPIDTDEGYKEELGIKWDTSFFPGEVSRFIIGGKVAQASFTVEDTDGDEVECVLRGTRDKELMAEPVELIAGIYDSDFANTTSIDIPAEDGTIKVNKTFANTEGYDIAYWEYDGIGYTFTTDDRLSQMLLGAIYDSAFMVIGATKMGRTIEPIMTDVDLENIEDATYHVTMENVVKEDDIVKADFTIYTMDLYDAVDVTTLKTGDTIIIRDEPMEVVSIEEEETAALNEDDEKKAVYVINGGLEEGGAELVAYEGGTFRYWGMDDYATFSSKGCVNLPIADDAVITDEMDIFTNADEEGNPAEGVTVKASEFADYVADNDPDFFYYNNTIVRIVNNEVVELTRIYVP